MPKNKIPSKAQGYLLADASRRDRATARRLALFKLLWYERSLTRENMIARVEAQMGEGCFGKNAWEDNFYRDMQAVKKAFAEAGYQLKYSRAKQLPGYYLLGEGGVHPELQSAIEGSVGEVDPRQIEIYRRLSFAMRFQQGAAISDTARTASRFAKKDLDHG